VDLFDLEVVLVLNTTWRAAFTTATISALSIARFTCSGRLRVWPYQQ